MTARLSQEGGGNRGGTGSLRMERILQWQRGWYINARLRSKTRESTMILMFGMPSAQRQGPEAPSG
eukprot:9075251-Pyramimonas_sp.AAC.1